MTTSTDASVPEVVMSVYGTEEVMVPKNTGCGTEAKEHDSLDLDSQY